MVRPDCDRQRRPRARWTRHAERANTDHTRHLCRTSDRFPRYHDRHDGVLCRRARLRPGHRPRLAGRRSVDSLSGRLWRVDRDSGAGQLLVLTREFRWAGRLQLPDQFELDGRRPARWAMTCTSCKTGSRCAWPRTLPARPRPRSVDLRPERPMPSTWSRSRPAARRPRHGSK